MMVPSASEEGISFLGLLPLQTHRKDDAFLYERAIAAISVLFFRTTVHQPSEHWILRWFFALLLAGLAYSKRSYELIAAVEFFSFAVPMILCTTRTAGRQLSRWYELLFVAGAAMLAISLAHFAPFIFQLIRLATPAFLVQFLETLFPILEMKDAYRIMMAFSDPATLQQQIHHLLFVTLHIQTGMGFLGIEFLRKEQHRRNMLIRMDIEPTEQEKKDNTDNSNSNHTLSIRSRRAHNFQRGAAPFILLAALPYMLQIIAYGNINKFAFSCLQYEMHRLVRVNQVFEHENNLIAVATGSATSPEGTYVGNEDTPIGTFVRNLSAFS